MRFILVLSLGLALSLDGVRASATGGGPDSALTVTRALLAKGAYSEAERAARELVASSATRGEEGTLETAEALHILATAMLHGGQPARPEIKAVASQALALRENSLGPDHPDVVESLGLLADVLSSLSEWDAARAHYERALAIRERIAGPDDQGVARILDALGALLHDSGDYAGARPKHERALGILERVLDPHHPEIAKCLGNLGIVLRRLGELGEARALLERAVAIEEHSLGSDHPSLAFTLNNLATVLWDTAEYAWAREALERSLAIREKALGAGHPRVATALTNLGVLLVAMGDDLSARPHLERALVLRETALGPDHPHLAFTLSALGALLSRSGGDERRGQILLERGLHIREKVLGLESPEAAVSLGDLADAIAATRPREAERLYERALGIVERSVGSDHPDVAQLLLALARVAGEPDREERAGALIRRALAIRERTFGPGSIGVAQARAALAAQLARTGDDTGALAAALEAEEAAREHVGATLQTLGERQALLYAETRRSALDLAVALSVRSSSGKAGRHRDILDSVVRSRTLVLDEMATRRREVVVSPDPAVLRLRRELVTARERLAQIVVSGPSTEDPARHREILDQRRREKEAAETALAMQSLVFRARYVGKGAGLEAVERALPAGTALVSFVRYALGDSTTRTAPNDPASAAYAAFVSRAGRDPALVPLGAAEVVEGAVATWRRAVEWETQAPGIAPRRSLARYMTAATALRRLVWDPVVPLLNGADTAFVVPDGALHLTNLSALPREDGRFVIEAGPRIHLLSAERDLLVAAPPPVAQSLLLVGAPEFSKESSRVAGGGFRGATSSCESFRTLRFSPLPGAEREIAAIDGLWGRSVEADPPSLVVLRGADADEAAFKANAPGRQIIHLATHGFVLGQECTQAGGSALLGSGLALAGANHRASAGPGMEDGILTAEEIATLDLTGVEWAVLSACQTGMGQVATGEGVLGLRRAFQVAGARSVIVSLWPVDDAATRAWMERLYHRRLQGRSSTIDAVRQASLDILRSRRRQGQSAHPLYWAGFVAVGDWR